MSLNAKYEVILEERDGSTLVSQEKFFSQFPIYTQNDKIFQLRIVGGQTELFEIARADLFNKQLLIDEGTATAKTAEDVFAPGQVAKVGGGQDAANALTTAFIRVITVASTGDSITLQVAKSNRETVVFNSGLNTLAVFPFTAGTFDGGAANASVNVPAGTVVKFIGTSATNWDLAIAGNGTLAAIMAIGNSTGAFDLVINSNQKITFDTTGQSVILDDSNSTSALLFNQFISGSVLASATLSPDDGSFGAGGLGELFVSKGSGAEASLYFNGGVAISATAANTFIGFEGAQGYLQTPTTISLGKSDKNLAFYGAATGVARQTGVAVTAAAIHAALVNLNLITA